MSLDSQVHLLFQIWINEEFNPDETLLGKDQEVDVYRKACMRSGIEHLYDRILEALEPSEGEQDA